MSFRPIFKKRDWVPPINELDWKELCQNPCAVQELDKIYMTNLSKMSGNIGAIELLELNLPNVNSYRISTNPAAAHLFYNFDKINHQYDEEYDVDFRYSDWSATYEYNFTKWDNVLDLYALALNPEAMDFLQKFYNIEKLIEVTTDKNLISNLCWNSRAVYLLEIIEKRDPNLLDYDNLVCNVEAIPIIERNLEKLTPAQWNALSFNYNAVDILKRNRIKIDWYTFSQNCSDNAIKYLLENPEKIDYDALHCNRNYKAIKILENKKKIKIELLLDNPIAIDIIEEYIKKKFFNFNNEQINYRRLSRNPAIFTLDKEEMKKQIDKKMTFSIETNLQVEDEEEIDMKIKYQISFAEELSKKAFNPNRISKYLNEFNYDLSSDIYLNSEED